MNAAIEFISGGTVTSAKGFRAGAVAAGIKRNKNLDLGVLFSEEPCTAAGVFTTNRIKSAPVVYSRQALQNGKPIAVVVNSGCANCSTGEKGLMDAATMATLAAKKVGVKSGDVLVAGTGVIGKFLPMDKVKTGIDKIEPSTGGGHELARAIMTTDTVPKEAAVSVRFGDNCYTIGGVAKGSGMIHPNMGTMLCFLATDATVEADFLKSALRKAAEISFNLVSVDGDTSPSDTVILLANGKAANKSIVARSQQARVFQQALNQVCIYLAKCIARDGEGATKLIEVTVTGARSLADARKAARTITNSPLVKTAVHGADPNWGRIIVAAGRSGAEMVENKTDLEIGQVKVVGGGQPLTYNEEDVVEVFKQKEVTINLNLNLGKGSATAWGCDLSKEYVTINSEYMT